MSDDLAAANVNRSYQLAASCIAIFGSRCRSFANQAGRSPTGFCVICEPTSAFAFVRFLSPFTALARSGR